MEQREEFITELENQEGINRAVETYMSSATASKDDLEEDVQIVVPNNNEELKEVIKFYDVKTDEDIDLKTDDIPSCICIAVFIVATLSPTFQKNRDRSLFFPSTSFSFSL